LKKVSEENRETTKKHGGTVSRTQISAPEHELKRVEKHHRNLRDSPVRPAGASHKKARLLSNKTHYNPHDPDARISVKPGKARKLNYHCSMAVDTAEGVIVDRAVKVSHLGRMKVSIANQLLKIDSI